MSEENNEGLGEELNDAAKKAADGVSDAAESISDKVEDTAESVAEEVSEAADNVAEEVKSSTSEFKEGWNQATQSKENKKLMAGLLALFAGAFGVHKFILGYNREGFILLGGFILGLLTYCLFIGIFLIMAVGIVSFIEGIIYLTKSDEEFYETYQANKKPWF